MVGGRVLHRPYHFVRSEKKPWVRALSYPRPEHQGAMDKGDCHEHLIREVKSCGTYHEPMLTGACHEPSHPIIGWSLALMAWNAMPRVLAYCQLELT